MRRCTIPRHRGAVKRKKERGQESQFPKVLCSLPQSATKVWWALVLSAEGNTVAISLRTIAARAGISVTQTRRALKRLVATKLVEITEPGRGRKATVFRLRWRLPSFPQPFVPSSPTPLSQRNPKRAPMETTARPSGASWSNLPIRNTTKALRWLMRQARREIRCWGLPPPRRERFLRAIGAAVWRALKRGYLRTTAAVRRFWWTLLSRLRDAREGISQDLKQACGFAGWCVLASLRELGLLRSHRGNSVEPQDAGESARTVVGSWRMEAEEAGGLQAFLEQEGIHSLVDYIRRKVIVVDP